MCADIQLENINKSYKNTQVLYNVSLKIPKGSIFGLLGPSGCGKTTLVKIISGISTKDSGNVYVLGKEMPDINLMSSIGYMAQSAALYPTLTAYDNLKFFGSLYGLKKKKLEDRINYVANIVNLSKELTKKVSSYSGGMKQRLSLAITLLSDPKVLILDEPTVGIDPVLRKEIWNELDMLSKKGVSILLTTHIMDEAMKCHKLAMMSNGSILESGTPKDIIKKSGKSNLEDAFIYFGQLNNKEGNEHENQSPSL